MPEAPAIQRLRVAIRGAVQGVGFRPFVHRLAEELGLAGWVSNGAEGVLLEVEGAEEHIRRFLLRLPQDKPAHAVIHSLEPQFLDPTGVVGFSIRHSRGGNKSTLVMADIAACPDCLAEIQNPANRRYRYPFTNCSHCGPRYSIIEALPYDRERTTMKSFSMCSDCSAEYANPSNRRFHAQPIACPACGPRLSLHDRDGRILHHGETALAAAADALVAGKVVALKGLGGFQLCVDARNAAAVRTLRERKHRQEKPFAVMVPTLAMAQVLCRVSDLEARLLCSTEAPIVLLKRHGSNPLVDDIVAPGNPYLGIMLPYTPLHHLLLQDFCYPIVATSGNHSEEPLCTGNDEALRDLGSLADVFLMHDRPIARPVDDSIAMVVDGREQILRRARGYAPLPMTFRQGLPPTLAVGAHLKNAVAVSVDANVFVSQHIGNLETASALQAFKSSIQSLSNLFEFTPTAIACDAHPDYASTRHAQAVGLPVIAVQHHYAHVLSGMADNRLDAPALGIAWDGTGLGPDRTIWGGEFLRITADSYQRVAHLRTFRLPGQERAVREPRRSAVAILYGLLGEELFDHGDLDCLRTFTVTERNLLHLMLVKDIQCIETSSAGRLFDAAASLMDLHQTITFEGQAAMALEFAAMEGGTDAAYPLPLVGDTLDWAPMIQALLEDRRQGVPVPVMAAQFHHALVEGMVQVCRVSGESQIVLTGGCFQNRYLLQRAIRRLRREGFTPYWHQRIPANDGGIALGQMLAVARTMAAAPLRSLSCA